MTEIHVSPWVFISFCFPPSVIYIFRHLDNALTSSGLQAAIKHLTTPCTGADGAQTMKLINGETVFHATTLTCLAFPSFVSLSSLAGPLLNLVNSVKWASCRIYDLEVLAERNCNFKGILDVFFCLTPAKLFSPHVCLSQL